MKRIFWHEYLGSRPFRKKKFVVDRANKLAIFTLNKSFRALQQLCPGFILSVIIIGLFIYTLNPYYDNRRCYFMNRCNISIYQTNRLYTIVKVCHQSTNPIHQRQYNNKSNIKQVTFSVCDASNSV